MSNGTFTRNYAVRGVAGGPGGDSGNDAGGAIFTVAGALTVTNSTVAGNESTGAGAGIVVYNPTDRDSASLALQNTILAGNTGRDECYLRGGVSASGTHNLVTPHETDSQTGCPGITVTGDPQLGALALNAPGRTPTMALSATSPAVDAGDPAVATLDDQRGVLRPQGAGVDIGAVEYSTGPTDVTAPAAAPSQSPAANAAGWNTADVTVTWNWADNAGGSGIDTTACTRSSTSSGEGANLTLSASCSDLARNTGSANYTVRVDKTAPTVICGLTPTFIVGSTPATGVVATVTDGLSGVVVSSLTATVTASDAAAAGVGSKSLTGKDGADNQTTISCPYVVAYDFLSFLDPAARSSYKRGSAIPVRFRLSDATGAPISDAAATSLVSPTCFVHVTLDDQVLGCAGYNADSDTFQYDVKMTKALSTGAHTIGVRVTTANGGVLNTDSMTVQVR